MKEKVSVYQLVDLDQDNEVVCNGSMNDIRHWAKNRWEIEKDLINEYYGIEVEEDFYLFLDEDKNLNTLLSDFGYEAQEICVIPIEDFKNDNSENQTINYIIREMLNACDDKRRLVHIGDLIANQLKEKLVFP